MGCGGEGLGVPGWFLQMLPVTAELEGHVVFVADLVRAGGRAAPRSEPHRHRGLCRELLGRLQPGRGHG